MSNLKNSVCAVRELMLDSDYESMCNLNNATFLDGEMDIAKFRDCQSKLGMQALVACPISDLRKVFGFVWYMPFETTTGMQLTRITRIAVHPAIHRCHNGYKLIAKMCEQRACRDVICVTFKPEDDCAEFFSALGFVASAHTDLDGAEILVRSKRWNPFPMDPALLKK